MELRHLKYFIALSEELSFVKAADKLCIAQPPLSRQIKELETEIGTRLFDRNNKRVQLTEAGKFFLKEVKEMLRTLEATKINTKKIGENINGEYNIAYISSTFSGDVAALLKYLSEKYPYMNFRLYEVPTQKQIVALELGKIDLGIVRGPVISPQLNIQFWYRDSFSFVFNATEFDIRSSEHLKALKDQTFVFFNKNYAPHYYTSLLEICSNYGFSPKVVHESNNLASILQMVDNGLGVSIVPSNTLKNKTYQNIGRYQVPIERFYSDVYFATKETSQTEVTKSAIAFLQEKLLSA